MGNTRVNISGRVSVMQGTKEVFRSNQIVNEGARMLLSALMAPNTVNFTNAMVLSNYPNTVAKKNVTFSDVKPYISPECIVGNNGIVNSDGTRDFKIFLSSTEPFEVTMILTIPASKGNTTPTKNAAVLIIAGDELQSVSQGAINYSPLGTETVFSIVPIDEFIKDTSSPFAIVWSITMETEQRIP